MSLLFIILGLARRLPASRIGGSAYRIPRQSYLVSLWNVYLHEFRRYDHDRALHDHPWPNCSILSRNLSRGPV